MPRKADTHVRVTEETWKRLNRRKGPGDSLNDVIGDILDEVEAAEAAGSEGNERAVAVAN